MHPSENKTARSSRQAFASALLELMGSKPYSEITVSELCQASGLSRQTFYSLFGSMDSVLHHAIRHNYNFPAEIPACSDPAQYIARLFSAYVESNYTSLKLLTDNGLAHIFYNCCIEAFSESWDSCLPQEPQEYLHVYLAGVLSGVVGTYMTQDTRREPEYLEAILRRLLDGSFFRGEETLI